TAQSSRPSSENSRVPSSGSTIHTRSERNRTGLSAPSSDSTASSGRSSVSASIRKSWDRLSPAAFRSLVSASANSSRTPSNNCPASVANRAASSWSFIGNSTDHHNPQYVGSVDQLYRAMTLLTDSTPDVKFRP